MKHLLRFKSETTVANAHLLYIPNTRTYIHTHTYTHMYTQSKPFREIKSRFWPPVRESAGIWLFLTGNYLDNGFSEKILIEDKTSAQLEIIFYSAHIVSTFMLLKFMMVEKSYL